MINGAIAAVGMIGVGLMGHGIASNILKHGYTVTLLSHPGNQPVDDLLGQGAAQTDSMAKIAQAADVIVLCVTGTPQVEGILYQPDGLLKHLRPGIIIIDCSTAIPSSTRKIARDVVAAGGRFLDAPMTRTPKEAAEGRLNLIVGGDPALLEHCRPLLESFAENIRHAGDIGSGHQMKLIHNFVSLGFSVVLSEAAACASRAGIDPRILLDILESGGGNGVVLKRLAPYIASGDGSGFRFTLANAHKDLGYYTTMAEQAGCFHDTATAILAVLALGLKAAPKSTMPELIDVLARAPEAGERR
ncbi:MAG: NAD(P)-dependent oxidoreductase [Candidimonas sp.]|nr:MAG: NAD(P)-dependent oxidoreductase [Candidimonas sp.]